jgi:hypothetical protein
MFEAPFWIALIENFDEGYSVAREVIGTSEPTGVELNDFFNRFDFKHTRFTRTSEENIATVKKLTFKRQIREARKMQADSSVLHSYSKAHTMLKLQRTENNNQQKKNLRKQKEELHNRQFELRQVKKKEKHKGH